MDRTLVVLVICGWFFVTGILLVVNAVHTSSGAASNNLKLDERFWYNPFIYNNPDDPALFVPRHNEWGQTLNFGHPKSRQFLIGLVVIFVGFISLSFLQLGPSVGCHLSGCHTLP